MTFKSLFVAVSLVVSFSARAEEPVKMLQRVCGSSAPVLVYDNYSSAEYSKLAIDLNGDLKAELSHGEYVNKIVELHGQTTESLDLGGEVSLPEVEAGLSKVAAALENGSVKYSRINFSQELPIRIGAFKNDLFANDPTVPEITAQNISEYKDKILQKIWTDVPEFRMQELYRVMERLQKLGVPVFVAAGNFGPNYVNMFSLLPNVISVGSLDLDGTKRLLSADNALVTVWRKGSFVSQQLDDGIDINGDGITDFSKERMTTDKKIVDMFAGKPASASVITVESEFLKWLVKLEGTSPANTALNVIPAGLYRVDELAGLPTVSPGTAAHFRKSGVFALKISTVPPTFFFDEDEQGNVVFDPLKTGESNQLMMLSGTSFAAPSVCAGVKL